MIVLLALLAVCAMLAAVAWNLARLLREARVAAERVRVRERHAIGTVRTLLEASRRSSADVIACVSAAVREAEPAIDAVLAFVPAGDELMCVYSEGPRVEHYARLAVRRDDDRYLPALAARDGHRACGPDGMLVPTDRSAVAVPMMDRGGLHAVVYASSRESELSSEDAIVQSIEHATSPYVLALDREHDRADATYDGLTGLLTPRAFRTALREEIARARYGVRPVLTLWFIDTDRFKTVNDTLGHARGDAVLHAMAALLRAHVVPEVDIAGRNGGDEFCALIHDTQKSVAIERAHAFCEAVRRYDFGLPFPVTASIGVASYPYDARDANELLEVADAAMYHSKRMGRDRVSLAIDGTSFAVFREPSTDEAKQTVHDPPERDRSAR
jgi:diguanylate cyclase (GGDEF)-like protein